MKIEILDPPGRVLNKVFLFCLLYFHKIQVYKHPDLKVPNSKILFERVSGPSKVEVAQILSNFGRVQDPPGGSNLNFDETILNRLMSSPTFIKSMLNFS